MRPTYKNSFIASVVLLPLLFVAVNTALAQVPSIPTGRAIDLDEILEISGYLADFLMYFGGGALAAIFIIWSGMSYLTAGSDSGKVKAAKDMLKAALIGTLIIFSTGVIIATIRLVGSGNLLNVF